MHERDIAIVGMACVFPRATNLNEYWRNLVRGVDAVDEIPKDRWIHCPQNRLPAEHQAFLPCNRGGFLQADFLFDPLKFGIMPNIVRHGDPDQFLAVHVIDQALADAGIAPGAPARKRTDVIMGRGGYPTGKLIEVTMRSEVFVTVLDLLERKFPEMLRGSKRDEVERYLYSTLSPNEADSISTAIPNIAASRAANRLDLGGAAYTVDAACSSSLIAVQQCIERLRHGQSDVAIASGLFLCQQPSFWHVFTRLGAISPSGCMRPFDRRADGLLIGEGAGAVVLKRAKDAIRDGDRVYAVIKGAGASSDGSEVGVWAPSSNGQVRALEAAYADAKLDPATISYLETHGTGTQVGDQVELYTIKKVFGQIDEPALDRVMGSVKSMIGHTMPAAGIASLIKVAMSLSQKLLPPSLHCEQPLEEMADAPFFINGATRPWIHDGAESPRRAGINTFGFGGINAHVVLEEVTTKPSGRKRMKARPFRSTIVRPTELVAFSAPTVAALGTQLERLENFLAADETQPALIDVAATCAEAAKANEPCKLGLICEDLAELRRLLPEVRAALASGETEFTGREDVYFSASATQPVGKIACLFPGMGFPGLIGNYPDHLMDLCLHYPEVREEFDFFEARDRHPEDKVPTSAVFSPPTSLPEEMQLALRQRLAAPKVTEEEFDAEANPGERYLAAMGVTLANWAGWKLLERFKLPVDMVCGQSQGEMAALCAADVSDFRENASKFWRALNVSPTYAARGRLAFVYASYEQIAPMLEPYSDVHVAIYMAPQAQILGGATESLDKLLKEMAEKEIFTQLLPYPPIHTPRLSYLRDEVMESMGEHGITVRPPKMALYSSITADLYPTDFEGVRDTLLLNIDGALRVWQTVRRMYDDGARIFVQCGGGHMAAHLHQLLPDDQVIVTAALDVETVHPLTQLNRLCAVLWKSGVSFRLPALFKDCEVRELDFDAPGQPAQPKPTAMRLRFDWSPLSSPNVPEPARPSHDSVATDSVPSTDAMPAETYPPNGHSANGAHLLNGAGENHSDPYYKALNSGPPMVFEQLIEQAITARAVNVEPQLETHIEQVEAAAAVPLESASEAPVSGMPLLGSVVSYVEGQELVMHRVLDIDKDLFLRDHHFVNAADVKPIEQCLPIMPMTMSMEMMSEAAACLCPGLGLIGLENVRAKRWMGINESPQSVLRVSCRKASIDPETGVHRVDAEIFFEEKSGASATLLFAQEYRNDVVLKFSEWTDVRPCDRTMEELYRDKHMFHGPAFQTICAFGPMSSEGIVGELEVLPPRMLFATHPEPELLTDPVVMDGIGQMVGLYMTELDWHVLPTGVKKVEIYRATPPVGTRCPIFFELKEFNLETKTMTADIEVQDGQGGVWMRLTGWSDWVFRWSRKFIDNNRIPSRYLLVDELALPDVAADTICGLVTAEDLRNAELDWVRRTYLHASELPDYHAVADNNRARRDFLMGRIAAKDVARRWLSRRSGQPMLHPAALPILKDAAGRPYIGSLPGFRMVPQISIAHAKNLAVAIASEFCPGIDVELANHDATSIVPEFCTEAESQLLGSFSDVPTRQLWTLSFWCAKEAVGKTLGTGLGGRPKDFEVVELEESGRMLVQHRPTGRKFAVSAIAHGELLLAHTGLVYEVTHASEASA